MPAIRKPLTEISVADLRELCDTDALEDEQIDFKQTIPHKRESWNDILSLVWRDLWNSSGVDDEADQLALIPDGASET